MNATIANKKLIRSPKSPCLIINLGNGVWVQHPIADESDARAIASHYSTLHKTKVELKNEHSTHAKAMDEVCF